MPKNLLFLKYIFLYITNKFKLTKKNKKNKIHKIQVLFKKKKKIFFCSAHKLILFLLLLFIFFQYYSLNLFQRLLLLERQDLAFL